MDIHAARTHATHAADLGPRRRTIDAAKTPTVSAQLTRRTNVCATRVQQPIAE